VVRKRGIGYLLSKNCRESAFRELFECAQAALAEDAFATNSILRDFLALDPLFDGRVCCSGKPERQVDDCAYNGLLKPSSYCLPTGYSPTSYSKPTGESALPPHMRLMFCAFSQQFK